MTIDYVGLGNISKAFLSWSVLILLRVSILITQVVTSKKALSDEKECIFYLFVSKTGV